jgi:hypothetical protein
MKARASRPRRHPRRPVPPGTLVPRPGTCSACGCTENYACDGGCSWANAEKTLCTKCLSPSAKSRGVRRAA